MPLKGSCLCRSIRYEITRIYMPIAHCHCTTCRKAQASAYATTAGVMRENFRWVAGEDMLSAYESSPGKLRYFCSRCGAHLLGGRAAQPHIILRVATLDDDPGIRPSFHIWESHDVPWVADAGPLPHYSEWQPGR